MSNSRVQKSIINAKVNLIFYLMSTLISFFSRKIFLDCLGTDFIGLTGTLHNILNFLNLAELGVGTAISYFLYKPILDKNTYEINEVLSVFGYLYKKIGSLILCIGIIISLFFPLIFEHTILELSIVYYAFFAFLGSALIGYFINYRQILLVADQKRYIISIYFQSAAIIKTIIQIFLAYNYKNLYVWISIELIFSIIGCIILNYKINKEYPWLECNKNKGKILLSKYQNVLNSTKQVFIHKIKDFLLTRSDEIMVFAFVSLKMVAYYGNYTLIVSKITHLFNNVLDGIGSGVGNLIAENNQKNTMKVFWELMLIRHLIAGIVCVILFFVLTPFIELWLGKEYILDNGILYLLIITTYIMQCRGTIDNFNHAYGLYADTWSAWVELGLNIVTTICAAPFLGIMGILLGKLVSLCFVVIWWKPYYLFKQGFKLPISYFWNGNIRYYIIFIVSFFFTVFAINNIIQISPSNNWINLIAYSILVVIIYLFVNLLLLYFAGFGAKTLLMRFKKVMYKSY